MKRALFVTISGSADLYLLRLMADREDPWFDARSSSDFDGVQFHLADVIPTPAGDDAYVLDSTAERLKPVGHNVFRSEKLGIPEQPLGMVDISKKSEDENDHITVGEGKSEGPGTLSQQNT